MELRRLHYFLRVAAHGSLNGASRSLGIAQPALGRQIQLLEAELGVQLFRRVAKGMRLTEEGDYLAEALSHPFQQIDIALKNICAFSSRAETTCTLGLPPVISRLLAPRLLRRLGAEMPNLKLTLIEDETPRLAAELVRGTVDMAILVGCTPDQRLFHTEMLSEPLRLVGAPGSALAGKTSIAFQDLGAFPLILPPPPAELPIRIEKLAARTACRIHIAHAIASLDVTKDLVRSGMGYALLSPLVFRDDEAAGTLISAEIVDPDLRQSVYVATQAHWRIPRSTYNQFHGIFYGEWIDLVSRGEWPSDWVKDPGEIQLHRT